MFTMINKNITEENLAELMLDFENDGYRHNGLVFNNWLQRHKLSGISIRDVSYLLKREDGLWMNH